MTQSAFQPDRSRQPHSAFSPTGAIEPMPQPDEVVDTISPPLWLKQFSWWFRIGLALFLLVSSLIGLTGCSTPNAEVPWQKASEVVPQAVLVEAITQNTSVDRKVSQIEQSMQAWEVPGNDGKLVVLDFNTPDLCGTLGCLYVGVWIRDNQPPAQVFATYLDPNLPENQVLFAVLHPSDRPSQQQALPCLKVMQLKPDAAGATQELQQISFCFDGQQYRVVDGTLYSKPTEPTSLPVSSPSADE